MNPLASKIVAGEVEPGSSIVVDAAAISDALVLRVQKRPAPASAVSGGLGTG